MPEASQITERFMKGDQFRQVFNLSCPGLSFSGAVARAQIRARVGGPLIATPAVMIEALSDGLATVTVTIPAAVSATLPERCMFELELEKTAAGWGPFTPVRVHLEVIPDVTR